MEPKELRTMSADELAQKRTELREEIGHLKLRRAASRLENPMKLRQTKRDLARVETILRERAFEVGKARHEPKRT
jgi:large subunit ribosomal protein L29